MEQHDFKKDLPAIWLVFGGSYLNHGNAPRKAPDKREQSSVDLKHNNALPSAPDKREQLLVDLLCTYLNRVLSSPKAKQVHGSNLVGLTAVHKLLELWSQDLDLLYQIRYGSRNQEFLVKQMAQRFLQRIKTFDNCTIIPNGLIFAQHSHDIIKQIDGSHDNVNLAILKKQKGRIDWVQVNPGSAYHQECPSLAGEKTNVFFEITEIDLSNITEEWLNLLVSLKTVKPSDGFFYKDVSLYECLLVFLNGKTEFQSEPDEGFIFSSPISPVRTWQVVDQSFRYLLQHFLVDADHIVYRRLLTGFKLFLIEKTFTVYQGNQTQECHFLLQEMCRDIAQHAVDQGNEQQKTFALKLINRIKAAIEQHSCQQELQIQGNCQVGELLVASLSFVAPHLVKHTPSIDNTELPSLKVEPVLMKPRPQIDIIDYLQQFKLTFMDKLINSNNLNEVALLSYGIEVFFIDCLAKTDILKKPKHSPYSKDDIFLANALKELAETYYSCQAQLVNNYLSNSTYDPHFYAKNVIVQFFVYAAIAALNLRHECIGPLLETYDLSVAVNDMLSLFNIIPHLVIKDAAWLKVLFAVREFFLPKKSDTVLFSYQKFENSQLTFEISNDAEINDTDVAFAYRLVKKDREAYLRFIDDHRDLEDEKLNRQWQSLAYGDKYLPSIYGLLSKVAHFAKVSLTGLRPGKGTAPTKIDWSYSNTAYWSGPHWEVDSKCYWRSKVSFEMNSAGPVSTKASSNKLTSYLLNSSSSNDKVSYQILINQKSKIDDSLSHLLENEIIGSQDKKPITMERNRYLQLGFLQSEPLLKIERLYIALKEQQLDFGCEQESVLIKQTLFEISGGGSCSVLEWTISYNAVLIHKLGLLCIEKARAMQYCLTQHHAVGDILEVILALLTFYPSVYKNEFIAGIKDIYFLLKEVLGQPSSNLSDHTLLHLNAYLIISVQGKPELLNTETLTVLKALLAIQNYKAKGVELDNGMLLRVHIATFTWSYLIESNLKKDPTILNDLMLSVIPQWDRASSWMKSEAGFLYACGDYMVKPLLGGIYFQNHPVVGLPEIITEHHVFKEYLGQLSFAVIPGSREIDNYKVPCYLSVDSAQQMRLTIVKDALIIEEFINSEYQRYIPAKELLGHYQYSLLLSHSPHNKKMLRHWLSENKEILVKDDQRKVIYRWNLETNFLFSLQHKGYVVPWDQLEAPSFMTWLKRIEVPGWIEIVAQQNSSNCILIQSLHFPRLGLHFDLRKSQFWCRQIHGYVLAKQQHLNTLHGFLNYLVLEKKELDSMYHVTKVIIPHFKVTPVGSFTSRTVKADFANIQSPAYFVYDYDAKTGMLKAQNTRAQLYLALLYYCSASLDDHDLSNCNAYHLACENLEVCWKDQPFDESELSIISQFLSPDAMRDFHCNRVAVYLKVVFLLNSSLRLAFLYTDEISCQNKGRCKKFLEECTKYLPFLLSLYFQNKLTVFARVRLSLEEEKDVTSLVSTFEAYRQLNFELQPQVVLSKTGKKSYKDHYRKLFSEQALTKTSFLQLLEENLAHFDFDYDTEGVNFSSGFDKILLHRFRLNHFITLYDLAKSSSIPLLKYCYLLHHIVLRAKVNYDRFPEGLVFMLARALLLVAENPALFPESPHWFGVSSSSIDFQHRHLTQYHTFDAFPSFSWNRTKWYDTPQEAREAREAAKEEYDEENEEIWDNLAEYDLDSYGIPDGLPTNPRNFALKYERHINCKDRHKRDIVRQLYLKAACNDAMCQFFVTVLHLCDQLKNRSSMGWSIIPFRDNKITVTIPAEIFSSPIPELVSLEKWAIPQQPLIALNGFFKINQQSVQKKDFLFESQLEKPDNAYQGHFYQELKDSWLAHHKEPELSYSWLNSKSSSNLASVLRAKYDQICKEATQSWSYITAQLKQRPNSESDNYFALRWHSGQVSHYHKGDLLRLLVEPLKIAKYNPNCMEKYDSIIKSLLNYVSCEINAAKILRVLALIEQYKQAETEEEKYSVLHGLVKTLEEKIDEASFRYPHWLLFQLENEIIVRENQRELIEAMLNQTEKAMYQLNMGEGKSSVILPLLCNNLANGEQILRINVLSALSTTMKNFLRQCFSGLIRKRVYTLPFHRDTDISPGHLKLIFEALQTCQHSQHILLVAPEHRLCLQLKVRELMLENQQQISATGVFNWQTYRERVSCKTEVYTDLADTEIEELLKRQDECLRTCLCDEKYIDSKDEILKVPPRGQGRTEFAKFKDTINDPTFREWSCLKAAYRELLYNSTLAHEDSSKKLALLNDLSALTSIDLLDESDEILRHGTELNYTMGDKHMFAGEELRWEIPQFFIKTIFCDRDLREIIIAGKAKGYTVLNERFSPRGGVPFIQLLDESYFEKSIKPLLTSKFFSYNLPTLRKYQVTENTPLVKDEKSSLKLYVTGQLPLNTEKEIMAFLADKVQLREKLLIAKGWLSHGILFHVLNAKYRVQYGLNLHAEGQKTKPIAIPFMGKDSPSARSEFSHPDVMLGFTVICYLYEGLSQQQLKETLMRLKDKYCHQVADVYLQTWADAGRTWIEPQTDSFPPLLLTSLNYLDLADEKCLEKLHQYLSGNHLTILFYLNQFILLQEAMQYLYKISANAHSLVGYDSALGFSGTDDRKLTMPFQVNSLRSATQEGTNGKLLFVLTENRNSNYFSLEAEDTNKLLKQLCDYVAKHPHCHALIDAGALVMGLSNYEAASFLLSNLPTNFQGVLYFSDIENSLTVLTRDNKTAFLQDCYLDKQNLFAYLDDIHTRGTDIKLPLNCHAILTVSIGMEKDKLMQAAMRLRQLAQKQSVSLWGTQAVTLAIARDNSVDVDKINSFEVIKWVTKNTIDHINTDLFPVAVRMINFQFLKKAEAWLKEAPTALNSLVKFCQEKESFLLEEFYALTPQCQDLADCLSLFVAGKIKAFWFEIQQELQSKHLTQTAFYEKVLNPSEKRKFKEQLITICDKFEIFLGRGFIRSSLDNDEEKEVEVEIIQEQEVLLKVEGQEANEEEKWDVELVLKEDFITLAEKENIIMPINAIKRFIQMPATINNIIWHPDVYMTANYIETIKSKQNDTFDNYLRPVDVILIHRNKHKTSVVLLSGNEAALIKVKCFRKLKDNLLMHLLDVDGPTQLPTGSTIPKQAQKLLTVAKLFSGECHYPSSREVQRLAKRVGRVHPDYFTSVKNSIDSACSQKLYGILIEEGYLDSSGIMTKKLMKMLDEVSFEGSWTPELMRKCQPQCQHVQKKLQNIYAKLLVQPASLKENHDTLRQWIGTRGRLKEFIGSALESIINSEYELKYSS